MKDNSLYPTVWLQSGISDMERLYMVMIHVDYRGIGQQIIGNILSTLSQKDKLQSMVYEQVNAVSNLTN